MDAWPIAAMSDDRMADGRMVAWPDGRMGDGRMGDGRMAVRLVGPAIYGCSLVVGWRMADGRVAFSFILEIFL